MDKGTCLHGSDDSFFLWEHPKSEEVFLYYEEVRYCDSKERNLKYFRDSDFVSMNVVHWVRQVNIVRDFCVCNYPFSGLDVGSFLKHWKNPCKPYIGVLTSNITEGITLNITHLEGWGFGKGMQFLLKN